MFSITFFQAVLILQFYFLFFHRFEEIAAKDKVAALEYLQTTIAEIIDHSDVEQTKEVGTLLL